MIRYIHLNPIEAGITKFPEEYLWSSHNVYFGRDFFTWLETDRILSSFGTNKSKALCSLADFMEKKSEIIIDKERILKAIRSGLFGSDEFIRSHGIKFSNQNERKKLVDLPINYLVDRICKHFNVTFEQLCGRSKLEAIVNGRSILAYACRLIEGRSLGDVSRTLNNNHGTVSRLAARVVKKTGVNSHCKRTA